MFVHPTLSLIKKYSILVLCFLLTYSISIAQEKTELTRLSLAKRSDGKGFVFRLHLSSSLDSVIIIQSGSDLIQFAAYSPTLILPNESILEAKTPIKEIKAFEIIGGIGFDIKIEKENYFITKSYPDANEKDWLIALTFASKNDLTILTEGITPIDWTTQIIPNEDDSLEQSNTITDSLIRSEEEIYAVDDTTSKLEGIDFDFSTLIYDDSYNKIKDKAKIDRIVIDAGHGGKDSGSMGYGKTKEKDIALAVAIKLGKLLEENLPDIQVIYTRKDDRFIPLEDRGHFANKVEGDLFISIHTNAAKSRNAYGTEVYFLGQHKSEDALDVMKNENSVVRYENSSSESKELTLNQLVIYELSNSANMANSQLMAGMIHEQFINRAGRHSRGVKQAGFIVLYYASMPSVLVELGFISNKKEERFLKSNYGQEIISSAIYRAVKEYKLKMDVK